MKTTIITPTIGTGFLEDCCRSVAIQEKPACHLLVVDGLAYEDQVMEIVAKVESDHPSYDPDVIVLPWNTGAGRMNGHRIYAAIPQLIGTDYFAMLDEDNLYLPDWVARMESALADPALYYVTCRRLASDRDVKRLVSDHHESIGRNQYGYALYDTSTWLLRTEIMAKYMHYMIVPEVGDRAISQAFIEYPHSHLSTYYGTIYRAPERLYDFFGINEQPEEEEQ
jgi:hypothetical protein